MRLSALTRRFPSLVATTCATTTRVTKGRVSGILRSRKLVVGMELSRAPHASIVATTTTTTVVMARGTGATTTTVRASRGTPSWTSTTRCTCSKLASDVASSRVCRSEAVRMVGREGGTTLMKRGSCESWVAR